MSQGFVLYVDGSARPVNPGFAGFGIHGYLYDTELTKKIPGTIGHILTPNGYVLKLGEADKLVVNEVIPVHYVDGFGSIFGQVSNNVAELSAAINGLRHANNYEITEVQVFTDSEYVRKGLEFWVDNWKKNNWLKQDGTEPANISYWKELLEIRDILVQRGVVVKINWVRGHTDILGNVLADKLATIASLAAMRKHYTTEINTSSPIGYWKISTGEHHPFIANSRILFNTMPEYIKAGEYYLGEIDKDDDAFGTRTSDGAYAVVRLEEHDPTIEMLRNYQSKIAYGADSIVLGRLDALYRGNIYDDICKYGDLAFDQTNNNRLDLFAIVKGSDGYDYKEPLTREFIPPKLCMRAVEEISRLSILLKNYEEKHSDLIVTDITNILYDITTEKPKKISKKDAVEIPADIIVYKLKPEYKVGYAALKLNVNYKVDDITEVISIIMTLGIDILNRNALKKLEGYNPKVSVITWMDSPEVMRYATIVEANNDIGIFAGVYSNRRIINKGN